MNPDTDQPPVEAGAILFANTVEEVAQPRPAGATDLARFVPHLNLMSRQLRQASTQIESSVIGVCESFQGIAERATSTVARATGFLTGSAGASTRQSFESMIEKCGDTLVSIVNASDEAGEVSRRAIERIRQMDASSKMISRALEKFEQIARENKMLALNAQIEAAHAGALGAGFAVVAVEVVSQTERTQEVARHVGDLIANLRNLAESTVSDLERMSGQDHKRIERCKEEADQSLRDMQASHCEMKAMLRGMTEESGMLASDIGSAVRGLQFQDRTSQQIAHVIEDLDILHNRLSTCSDGVIAGDPPADLVFSSYTMHEERQVANSCGTESPAGDIELF